MTTDLPHDEFFDFLVREGLLDETTVPSGTDRMAFVQARVDAGLLQEADLDAAKARFLAQRTATTLPTRPGTADPLIGRMLGGCRIDALLGQGGMGSVYLATQLSLDRPVAVKVQNEVAIPELVERFRIEAKTLGRLHSAHIVDVYEVGTENGVPWFVMEFMPGGSLASHVRKLPDGLLPRTEARRLLLESAQGLAEAERHGVLHRDIKPDNLLLDANGTLKIADFGIAKIVHEDAGLTASGFSPGTPAFQSPEQFVAGPLDFRTDMYSLGLSFWSLVTGQRPRNVVTRQEALHAPGQQPLPWSSPELAEVRGDALLVVICRMMALKREDRFASWQQLIDEVRALPADGLVRPPARRTAAKVLAAALLLGAGVGAWLWSRPAPTGDGPQPPARSGAVAETTPAAILAGNTATTDPPKDAATSRPAERSDAIPQAPPADPKPAGQLDAEVLRQFLLELEQPLPDSPRSADDVRTTIGNVTARATAFALLADARYVAAKARLERELQAAEVRDGLRAQRALAQFGELAALRARADAIALPNYRDDARAWLDELERTRPRFLRVSAADHEWLARWATWSLEDSETAERAGRFLPSRLVDARRGAGCTMVLLWSDELPPAYVDATEVTLAQWTAKQPQPAGLDGPANAELPVRNVEPAAIDAFLAAWSLRLPTLAEFTFALETRRGDRSWWGNTLEPPRDHARLNIADQARREQSPLAPYLPGYEDGVPGVAAAADPRFVQGRGRAFHHLLGNVAEWVTEGASSVVLGGSYMTSSWETFECRYRQPVLGSKRQDLGFRAARSVPTGN